MGGIIDWDIQSGVGWMRRVCSGLGRPAMVSPWMEQKAGSTTQYTHDEYRMEVVMSPQGILNRLPGFLWHDLMLKNGGVLHRHGYRRFHRDKACKVLRVFIGSIYLMLSSITSCLSLNDILFAMASANQMLSILRKAAPRLTRDLFTCRHRCKSPYTNKLSKRLFGSSLPHQSTDGVLPRPSVASLLDGAKTSQSSPRVKTRYFPETSDKSVAYWLLGSAASVFGIVVFGGLTRLTESGYAIFLLLPRLC